VSRNQRVSQQQIARELGVSQPLVSLVLNGRRKGVDSASYQRIWNRAIELGYRPKGMIPTGDQDSTAGPLNVGFILRSGLKLYTQSNFFSHIQHGLHEQLTSHGINTVFLGSEEVLDEREFSASARPGVPLLGLVIMGEVQVPFLQALRPVHRRIVAVSASYPGLCHSVTSNEERSLEILVRHLRDLGHRRFAWIGGNAGMGRNLARFKAFEDSVQLCGLEARPEHSINLDDADRLGGRQAAQLLLDRRGRPDFPTAWVCYNGLMARGAINYLLQKQISVPEQISVVAVDATRVCVEDAPHISSAGANPERMGAVAGELILNSTGAEDEVFTDVTLPSHLAARNTSGPVAVNGHALNGYSE
jgi:LacI family transcriptional regulator